MASWDAQAGGESWEGPNTGIFPQVSIINEICVVMVMGEQVELGQGLRKYCNTGSYKIYVTVCILW